jgi:hypothetical protein
LGGVTVSGKASPALILHAKEKAAGWGLPFVERPRKSPLGPLLRGAGAMLVFGEDGLTLVEGDTRLRFHPGLARLRIMRLDEGLGDDALLQAAELRPGDMVLDATLGLGQDALVAARIVGPFGSVVGLEKSLPLFAVTSEGLKAYALGEAMCRVTCIHVDSADFLARQPARSFDCVLFDPMFERPRKAQPSFDVLRKFADYSPLTPSVLWSARRVARRCVAIKASPHSKDLPRLGLRPLRARRDPRVVWARVDAL